MSPGPSRSGEAGLRWGLPVFRSLDGYRRSWLPRDLVAGALIVAIAVPLSMGMAEVAGMPPIAGLYSCVLPLIAYALLGSSRQLVIALDASTAALLAAAVTPLAGGDAETYAALAGLVALLVGAILLIAGVLRLGFLGNFLSQPVILGYQAGLAIVVTVSQLPTLLGFGLEEDGTIRQVAEIVRRLDETNVATLLVGLASLALILALRAWKPAVPGALLAVALATIAAEAFDLAHEGVSVLGELPSGLPSLTLPSATLQEVAALIPPAAGIALIAAADTIASARAFAQRGGYQVDSNLDLIGLGAANLSSGISGGISVSASAARTAVAESTGSRSQVAGVTAALLMVAVLLFFTRPLQNVPTAALAAVVISAVLRLIEVPALRRSWRVRRSEFLVALATTGGAVVFGLLQGILIAVVVAILDFVRRATLPHDAVIGRIDGRQGLFDVARYPIARTEPGLLVYRLDAALFYANAERFLERAVQLVDESPDVRWFVLDASVISDVDLTAAETLIELHDELDERGVELVLVDLLADVQDLLSRAGLLDRLGRGLVFDTAEDAIDAFRARPGG
jgi:high affinity sulfate transporter 1